MWNERFSSEEYIFGTEPNEYFRNEIDKLQPGKLLLVGEGEGRNAVYAAKKGWQVDAFDFSEAGKKKALQLAQRNNVSLNYIIKDFNELGLPREEYDAAAAIYIHVEENLRMKLHKSIFDSLKRGGTFIFEAYEKEQLKFSSGGPQDPELLYSLDMLVSDFIDYEFLNLGKENIFLNESSRYKGEAVVIRFTGVKNEKLD